MKAVLKHELSGYFHSLTISDSTSSILKLVMIGVFPIVYLAVGIAIVVKRRRANEAN